MSTSPDPARYHLAWLMWCFNEGYTTVEDRNGGIGNWLLRDEATLVPEDVKLRDDLLAMADEVLAAQRVGEGQPVGEYTGLAAEEFLRRTDP